MEAGMSGAPEDAGSAAARPPDPVALALRAPSPAPVALAQPAAVPEPIAEAPDGASEPVAISEASRQELLGGLAQGGKKGGRGAVKGRKSGEPAPASRGPVDGTLLRPGAEPERCRMELL
jgi:hypothetical protein